MPSAPIVASATAPLTGSVTGPVAPRAPASSTVASAHPAARSPVEVDGPTRSTSSTTRSGSHGRDRCRDPRRARHPQHAPPVRVRAAGDRRPLRARAERRPRGRAARGPARPCWSASDRAALVTMLVELAPEGAAVGERRARFAAGLAPGRVRLQVRRLDPGGPQRGAPSRRPGGRAGAWPRRWCGGPGPCRRWRGPRRASSPTAQPPCAVGHGDERVRRRGVVGEAALAEGDLGSHRLRAAALDRGARRGRREVTGGRGRRSHGDVPGIDDGAPPRAPAEVGEERLLDRLVVGRLRALGPQALEPADDPRRAEPALARARGAEGVGPARPRLGGEAIEGDDRSSGDPSSRGDARDPRLSVDQHRAAAALALGAAAVLRGPQAERRSQHVEERSAVVGDLDLVAVDLHLHRGELTSVDHGRRIGSLPMPARLLSPVSRRQFLLGSSAAAGAVLLGGCGGNDVGRRRRRPPRARRPLARAVLRGLPDAGGRPRGASPVRGRRMPRACSRSIARRRR